MNKKIKVLHLLTSSSFSGAENVVCQIINSFSEINEFEICYCSPEGKIRGTLNENNIKFLPIKKFSISNVKEIIKIFNPDIIHAHDIRASVVAGLVSKKCKVISHLHGNHNDMKKINAKTISYLIMHKKFEEIICVSESIKCDFVFSKVLERAVILYNVLNRDQLISKIKKDLNNYNYDLVFLGRLNNIKNPLRIVDIFNQIYEKDNKVKMAFIGDGELKGDLINKIKELNLQENISVLGYKKNPYKILSQSKVLIMASKYEGTPMCVLESMALGIPVVSTPIDGIKDIIEDGVNGFLASDDIMLSKYIYEIISNSEKSAKMSKNSLDKFYEINNIENYKKTIINIYNK